MYSLEFPLDCCSLAGLNRASLSNLAPVWSVIAGHEGEVVTGACGAEKLKFPRALLFVLHKKGMEEKLIRNGAKAGR